MPDAETATTAVAALDPVLTFFIGALGASVIGLIGAIIGGVLTGQREHKKWLRERRFDAYHEFMVDMDVFSALFDEAKASNKIDAEDRVARLRALRDRIHQSHEAVSLLGPRAVNNAGQRWVWAAIDLSKNVAGATAEQRSDARWKFLIAAGKQLKSKNVGSAPLKRPSTDDSNDAR